MQQQLNAKHNVTYEYSRVWFMGKALLDGKSECTYTYRGVDFNFYRDIRDEKPQVSFTDGLYHNNPGVVKLHVRGAMSTKDQQMERVGDWLKFSDGHVKYPATIFIPTGRTRGFSDEEIEIFKSQMTEGGGTYHIKPSNLTRGLLCMSYTGELEDFSPLHMYDSIHLWRLLAEAGTLVHPEVMSRTIDAARPTKLFPSTHASFNQYNLNIKNIDGESTRGFLFQEHIYGGVYRFFFTGGDIYYYDEICTNTNPMADITLRDLKHGSEFGGGLLEATTAVVDLTRVMKAAGDVVVADVIWSGGKFYICELTTDASMALLSYRDTLTLMHSHLDYVIAELQERGVLPKDL